MPILPENQYPPNNYAQQTTPVFQPPLGVDLNISQINHSRISQPSKNVFTLLRRKLQQPRCDAWCQVDQRLQQRAVCRGRYPHAESLQRAA